MTDDRTPMQGMERPFRILFVDDEPSILAALVEVCEKVGGFTTATVLDAPSALREIERLPPDIVVSDHRMPFMTGIALLTQLRATRPRIVRVLITADPQEDVTRRAVKEGGVHAIIEKPWQLRTLLATLNSAATQARMQRIIGGAKLHQSPQPAPRPLGKLGS